MLTAETFDPTLLRRLGSLRAACNTLGYKAIANRVHMPPEQVESLCRSHISGLQAIGGIFIGDAKDTKRVGRLLSASDRLRHLLSSFAGVGERRCRDALRVIGSPESMAAIFAIEVEHANLKATLGSAPFVDKHEAISRIRRHFKQRNWNYGIGASHDGHPVIYFEPPHCEQLAWRYTPKPDNKYPSYIKGWDGHKDQNLARIEAMVVEILK